MKKFLTLLLFFFAGYGSYDFVMDVVHFGKPEECTIVIEQPAGDEPVYYLKEVEV